MPNKRLYTDATDEGYETDDTIPIPYNYYVEHEYSRQQANKRKQNPSTPPPKVYGPEPSTELVDKHGEPIFTKIKGVKHLIPYTRNDLKNKLLPLDKYGNTININNMQVPMNLFRGGVKSNRRSTKKSLCKKKTSHKSRTKHSRRIRKSSRRYKK